MTPTTTEPRTFDLGKTLTYKGGRRVGWYPATGAEGDCRVGTARIVCQRGRRPGDSDSVDEYGVSEETCFPLREDGWREFLIVNDTDSTQPDVVLVGEPGATCTCKASLCRVPNCKHIAAISRLLAEGLL